MARAPKRQFHDAFSDFDQVPVSASALGGRMRNWGWMILGGMTAGFVALLLGIILLVSGGLGGSDAAPVASSSSGKASGVAAAALQSWLGGVPYPGASTADCSASAPPFADVGPVSWQRALAAGGVEVHTFVLVADGLVWDAAVTVRFDQDDSGSFPVVDGCPMVQLAQSRKPVPPEEPWPGWVRSESSEKFVTQAETWAGAYFGGDADALFRVTGDVDPSHRYQPAGSLWDVTGVSIVSFSAGDGTSALAQVQVETRQGVFSFDLLFGSPSAALPPVVAWGPVGSGPLLSAYGNAVTVAVTAPTSTTSTTTSTIAVTSTTAPAVTSTTAAPAVPPAVPVDPTTTTTAAPADGT